MIDSSKCTLLNKLTCINIVILLILLFILYYACVSVYLYCSFQEYVFSKSSLSGDQITAMHSTSVGDVDDMARLGDLHEASILNNLAKRYKKDTIYVSVAKAFDLNNGDF